MPETSPRLRSAATTQPSPLRRRAARHPGRSSHDLAMSLGERLARLPSRFEREDPAVAAILAGLLAHVEIDIPGSEGIEIGPLPAAGRSPEAGVTVTTGNGERIVVQLKTPTGFEDPLLSASPHRSLATALDRLHAVAAAEPLRAAFLIRCLNGLTRLAPALDPDTLGDATGARSDIEVLLHALESPGALAALADEDPLAEARLRDVVLREQLRRAEGGVVSAEGAARILGVTRQAIDKRRREGRLLAIPIAAHRYEYLAWQFADGRVLPGLEDVLAAFTMRDPWTLAGWFLGTNSVLDGERPLDVLRRGDVLHVRRAAALFGEHGAA